MADGAVFLDRDGVINRLRADHVKSWSEFEFLPGSLAAISALRQMGERVVVVTNQSVVGRGIISADDLSSIHRRMTEAVEKAGGHIEAIYACLHHPRDRCGCRKPRTELLVRAAVDLRLELRKSILVGDSHSDLEAARGAGCVAIYVGDSPLVYRRVQSARDLQDSVTFISRLREVAAAC